MGKPLTREEAERAATIGRELDRRPCGVSEADAAWLLSALQRAGSATAADADDAMDVIAGGRLLFLVAGLIPWPPDDMPALRM